jgi:inorganic pyrophosphatase
VVPPGFSFPYDFGVIPSTIVQDGDSLDVLKHAHLHQRV